MGKFEYCLIGVMAFLVLGILGMIAVSPDKITIELKEELNNIETSSESKSITSISIDEKPLESESATMVDESMKKNENIIHTHEIIIPQGVGIPGCEENNECFVPSSISIKSGHAVIWKNEDTAAHTVTSGTVNEGPNGIFDSSIFMSGKTFEHTFDESGSYDYFCIVHPWMIGTIKVT